MNPERAAGAQDFIDDYSWDEHIIEHQDTSELQFVQDAIDKALAEYKQKVKQEIEIIINSSIERLQCLEGAEFNRQCGVCAGLNTLKQRLRL